LTFQQLVKYDEAHDWLIEEYEPMRLELSWAQLRRNHHHCACVQVSVLLGRCIRCLLLQFEVRTCNVYRMVHKTWILSHTDVWFQFISIRIYLDTTSECKIISLVQQCCKSFSFLTDYLTEWVM
jgi:hypothetical protein